MHRVAATLLLSVALAAFAPPGRAAEPISPAERQAVRAVVEAQLAAFAADDAALAFSYAAPAIRAMFQTPERFLAMVRSGYPAVYRPSGVVFLHPVRGEAELIQGVQLTDAAGALWLAVYRLQRQPDQSWRINGCDVQPSSGKMT